MLNLTKRDYEILRTLVRVQFATTRSLQVAFFMTLGGARKRLAMLRAAGLLGNHSNGLPQMTLSNSSSYWRITEMGLRTCTSHFSTERVPDNLIVRTQRASLLFHAHRDEMTNLYLRLIASQDLNAEEMRSRADIVDWRGEFEVELPYRSVEGARFKTRKIVPDATLTTPHARYFVEVDCSTESRKRCRRTLLAYASAFEESSYGASFPDQLPPSVIYVTRSAERADSLRGVIAGLDRLPYKAHAMGSAEATEWLCEAVTREPGPRVTPLMKCSAEFRRLYEACCTEISARTIHDVSSVFSQAVVDAYQYLQGPSETR